MYLFCPRCNTQHLASSRCPRCSSRLLAPAEASDLLLPVNRAGMAPPPPSTPGFGGRVLIGSLVALGLHLALREWVLAAAGAVGVSTLDGELWVGFALRVVGAAVGGVLAGAGRGASFSTGAVVGAACGVAWLGVDAYPDVTPDLARLLAAVGLGLGGGVAAVVGGVVWPPPVEVKPPEASHNSSLFKLKTGEAKRRGRPVAWVRVILAATVAVCGVMAADGIRQGMMKMPKGTFNNLTMSARTDALIAGFIGILAGVVAGAATGRGWREGAIAGTAAALGTAVVSAGLPDGPPLPVQYVIDQFGMVTDAAGVGVASVVLLAVVTVGGWFGGQLLPVLRKKPRLGDGL